MPKSLFPAAAPELREKLECDPTLKLINEFDWAANPLGPIPEWPESLKGAVRVIMLASTPMVMMVGPQGILVYNNAYAEFAGTRHPEIFGMPALEAWPEIAEFNAGNLDRGMAGESWTLRDQELVLNRHGQLESGWMDLHYSPLLNDDGLPLGLLCIVRETTDRILVQKALARSEERLSLALSGSNLVATWDWDVAADLVTADDRFARLYGVDPLRAGLGLPVAEFLAGVHPDDADRVSREIEESLSEGKDYHSEYRVRGADGVERWIVASGRPRC